MTTKNPQEWQHQIHPKTQGVGGRMRGALLGGMDDPVIKDVLDLLIDWMRSDLLCLFRSLFFRFSDAMAMLQHNNQ